MTCPRIGRKRFCEGELIPNVMMNTKPVSEYLYGHELPQTVLDKEALTGRRTRRRWPPRSCMHGRARHRALRART
jgi:hypothetical protein